ncbi:MAG TPA: signal peptide peptidase SppA [Bryobacteraceae bacterium]|nr:signal peptide peptidase SppA [Bryobacteraceae bacterium]
MKRFALGFVIGLLFAGLVVLIIGVAAMRLGTDRPPAVADGTTLVLHLEGELPEQPQVTLPIPFLEDQQPMTMVETWQLLRKAAADPRIKALVLEPRELNVGWAKLEELRGSIVAFKKTGKLVYAYLRGSGTKEYYVATAADRVFMAPEDELDVKGLRAELMFVKGTLDKLGVGLEFEHVGKYKDAPDMFTRTTPTPETLEVENQILDQYFGDIIAVIAEGRKKKPEDVKTLIDDGPFVGKSALDGGLVDALVFEDEMYGKLKDAAKLESIKKIGERDYSKVEVAGVDGKTKIAFIVGQGEITRGGTNDTVGNDGITASGLVKLMRQVRDDATIKGVILRIDSPGGDGIASDDILHEAKLLSAKKPTVISMSDLAASGGYFIAMTGDPVIAYPNTLTGSIGVFFGKVNLKGLFEKVGLATYTLKRGRFSDIDSSTAPLDDEQRAKLRREIETFYKGFVERVAAGRKQPYEKMEPLAQGRVWLGAQAKQNGLVDELGGLDRAIEMVRDRAKISSSEKIVLVTYPPKRTVWDVLFNRTDETSQMEAHLRPFIGRLPLRALAHGGILRLMPFAIDVK